MSATSHSEASLFQAARERLNPADQAAFLQQACGDDDAFRRRLVSLLHVAEREPGFLEDSPMLSAEDLPDSVAERAGDPIGPYLLTEQIGEGGFAIVYVAEQLQPVRRLVALKLLKPGMDSHQIIARFELERQALAMMDHPHIAKVWDAGTTPGGRPYFVMELVRGAPITAYCDQQRLTLRQRLELFIPVCQAIQHAHQKGVIHRDIKPANVLVAVRDGRPAPTVIDFGVAKAVGLSPTDPLLATSCGSLVGTVEYMSPEQAGLDNLDIDTRSDVYSLGVLLHELLTGVTPVERSSVGPPALLETLRVVRDVEVLAPSVRLGALPSLHGIAADRGVAPERLAELMRGELDWILLKALDKDRSRRYQTASALALDIERYLADEVVEARPPSTGYRLRKLARRHRAALTGIAAAALCLIVGASLSLWQAVRAGRAEFQALTAAQTAQRAQVAADQRRDEAERERVAAQQERLASQRNLVTSQLLLARIANSEGDLAGALTWYGQAYRHTAADDPRRVGARNLISAWSGGLRQTLVHDDGVHTLAVSADGRKLLAGYFHSRAQLWDVATGTPVGAPLPHSGDIVSAQLSADGGFALVGDWEGAKVWALASGAPRYATLAHQVREDTVVAPLLSPDGRSIITRSPLTAIRLWDADTGRPRGEASDLGVVVDRMLFSPDSKWVAARGAGLAQIWDVDQARAVGEPFTDVTDIAFHPTRPAVAISRRDGKLVLRDIESGQQLAELDHDRPLLAVRFDSAGRSVVAHDGESAHLWLDVFSADRAHHVLAHGRNLVAAQFAAADDRLLTASPGLLRIWRVGADNPLWEQTFALAAGRAEQRLKSASFSPDGKRLLVTTADGKVDVLSAKDGQSLARESNVLATVFASDGSTLFTGSRDGRVRSRAVGADMSRRTKAVSAELCSGSALAVSPDGKLVFVVGAKSSHILRIDTWEPVGQPLNGLYHDFKDMVTDAAFSPDSRLLVTSMSVRGAAPTAPSTGRVEFWDVASTTRIGEPLPLAAKNIAFDTTGKSIRIGETVYAVDSRSIRRFAQEQVPQGRLPLAKVLTSTGAFAPPLWDEERNVPTTIATPADTTRQPLLSPDGSRLLSVGMEGQIRLQDATTGAPAGPPFPAEGTPRGLSSDGRYVLMGSQDALRLWDATLGRPCGEPLEDRVDATFAFSPDGSLLATHGRFSVRLWDCATGLMLGPPLELSSNQISRPLFSPDGHRLYVPSHGLEVLQVPSPAADEPERLRLSIEVRTGLEVDELASIQKLTRKAWLERKQRLAELGGPCD